MTLTSLLRKSVIGAGSACLTNAHLSIRVYSSSRSRSKLCARPNFVTRVNELVNVTLDGDAPNSASVEPAADLSGRYIAFDSFADNLVTDDTK